MNLSNQGRSWGVFVFAIAAVLFLSASVAYGQSAGYANISGRVLDPKGASVPDAAVTAMNVATGIARTTTTTSDGLYRLENLTPGVYDVTIGVAAFTKAVAKGVRILVGETRDVNFNLELAGQKESVVVTSEIPLIETTKTDVSVNLDDRDLASLPTTTAYAGGGGVANDWQGLAYAAPGMRTDYTGLSSEIIGPGAVNSRGVVHNIDGGDVSDVATSVRDSLGASVEEVKEFQVITNNYNAEYGQAGGVILNVITKSGTNAIHGDGHAYIRGRNMGASDFFYNQGGATPAGCPARDFTAGVQTSIAGCGRAKFFKHEYGFTAGGPFIKDRLFWFTSLEQVQQGVPQILTPFGRTVTVDSPTTEIIWSSKVDAKLTDKHTLTARFNQQRDLQDNLIVQTGPAVDPSGLVSAFNHDHTLNVAMVSTPTPHTANEARFFWHWERSGTPDKSNLPGQALPNAYVGADFCCPQAGLNNRFQYSDNFSWTHGSHTLKAGTLISHLAFDSLFTQFRLGRFENFVPGPCVDPPFPQGNGLCPTSFTVGVGAAFNHIADTAYGLYIQDTWQLKRNLTMNYGIRYDVEIGAFDGGTINRVQNFAVPQSGCLQRNNIIPACGHDYNNWQPRLGFAWSPNYEHGFLNFLFGAPGKSVVRIAGAEITELAYLNVVLDSLNFDGVSLNTGGADTSTALGRTILGQFPNFPSQVQLQGLLRPGFFGRVRPISPTIKNPEIHQASLSITRQVGQSFVYSVGYQGVFGNGLFGETDENFPQPIADPAHAGFFYMPPRPDRRFKAKRTNFSNRTSSYNALVLTASKRLSHHFQFGANYTNSKTLGTGEDFFGLSEPGNPLANLKLERAPVQQDIRHLANFTFVVDTEKLTGMRFARTVVNDWTFSFIGSVQTGRPYPVSTGSGGFSGSAFPALGSETNQRPNICTAGSTLPGCAGAPVGAIVATNIASNAGSNLLLSQNGVAACNNPALLIPAGTAGAPAVLPAAAANCGALQTTFLAPAGASGSGPVDSFSGDPVDFQFLNGNLARNAGLTKGLTDFDISLLKAFRIPKRESMRVEIKMDVFNVFNHTNFIANDSNDNISALGLASPLTTTTTAGVTTFTTTANFNCAASCVNPFSGLYLGANGAPLTLGVFRSGRADKNLSSANWASLGDPAATVQGSGRIIQLALRIRW
ncbi:MAG TPA: TonB-dependent receptor [Candidatus Acidoferrum sp.]|nr:TonB-dependent receptor [Candidatus Acidoferrum sp.]